MARAFLLFSIRIVAVERYSVETATFVKIHNSHSHHGMRLVAAIFGPRETRVPDSEGSIPTHLPFQILRRQAPRRSPRRADPSRREIGEVLRAGRIGEECGEEFHRLGGSRGPRLLSGRGERRAREEGLDAKGRWRIKYSKCVYFSAITNSMKR